MVLLRFSKAPLLTAFILYVVVWALQFTIYYILRIFLATSSRCEGPRDKP